MGGVCCDDCDFAPIAVARGQSGVRDYAVDGQSAQRRWAIWAELTGIDGFAGGLDR